MKINFTNLSEDVRFAVSEGARELGFTLSADGTEVRLDTIEEGVHLRGSADGPYTLGYANISALMRGLGLLSRYAGKGEAVDVRETPSFDTLGPMVDCSRNAVMKPECVKDFIRLTAVMGFNAMMLYTEDTYEVPGEPYFGHLRGRYTQAELRDIDAYAAKLGVELIPCIQTLAHLSAILQWPAYGGLRDWDDILDLALPRTYELLENCIRSARESFRSKRINIGMDEAYLLGRGHYLDKKGYRDSSEIMLEHLDKVVELCKKYDFAPRMWSDMFFRMCNESHEYYAEDSVITEHVKSIVPPEITLIYWDYYGDDRQKYDRMLDNHLKFNNPVAFAGGTSCWYGLVPLNRFSVNSALVAMAAARAHDIREIYVTMWGDNGAQCSMFSTLPTLVCYAENDWNGRTDEENLSAAMKAVTGASYESFMDFEKLMDLGDRTNLGKTALYPTRYMLYQDVLQGKFDCHVPDDASAHFMSEAKRLVSEREDAPEQYRYLYDSYIALARALTLKADLGKKLKAAYDAHDTKALKELCDDVLPETAARVRTLLRVFRTQWMKDNKPFGFEIHDIRFGGLMARLESARETVRAYLNGEIARIEELEEPRLPYDPDEPDNGHGGILGNYLNLWAQMVTQNGI
ncbi:MAG: beta-N-acetylhexosaminidase [Lachnospiraceae bacterium]|nr:beta-N-acetylhexosaminidase [Lachnospiraceae bacterium]